MRYNHQQLPSLGYTLVPDARPDRDRWCWPLPALGSARPCVIRRGDDSRLTIEVGYQHRAEAVVPVYAVHDGALRLATQTNHGYAITIDHGETSSHCARLDQLTVSHASARRGVRVRAGQVIGYANRARPIRFELWRWTDEHGFVPARPEPHMSTWLVLSERDPNPSGAQSTSTHAARDAAA